VILVPEMLSNRVAITNAGQGASKSSPKTSIQSRTKGTTTNGSTPTCQTAQTKAKTSNGLPKTNASNSSPPRTAPKTAQKPAPKTPAELVAAAKSRALWKQALDSLEQELDKADLKTIKQTKDFNSLQKSLAAAKKQYKDRLIPRLLDRIDPFLNRLKSFSGVLDTFSQSDSTFTLLWGSLKLVLEVTAKKHGAHSQFMLMTCVLAACDSIQRYPFENRGNAGNFQQKPPPL
jgi:hypothetical protein